MIHFTISILPAIVLITFSDYLLHLYIKRSIIWMKWCWENSLMRTGSAIIVSHSTGRSGSWSLRGMTGRMKDMICITAHYRQSIKRPGWKSWSVLLNHVLSYYCNISLYNCRSSISGNVSLY
jgi:hypothetical protein